MEMIVSAAVYFYEKDSKYPKIFTGKRHANIFEDMYNKHIDYDKSTHVQGFLTSYYRFVDRYEAKRIAVAANQLIVPEEKTYAELFSEDVW